MKVDWLFKNVTVIDGSGGPQYRADVAVKGDRIMAIAPALDVAAEQVIDGQGRVLAPGFIDVHTHDDINVIRMPEYLPKLSQGGDDGDRRQLRDQCGDRHHAGGKCRTR